VLDLLTPYKSHYFAQCVVAAAALLHVCGGFGGVSGLRTCLIKRLPRQISIVICRLSNPECLIPRMTPKRAKGMTTPHILHPKNGKCAHFSLTIYYQPLRIGISDSPSSLIRFQRAGMKRPNPHLPSPPQIAYLWQVQQCDDNWNQPLVSFGGVWILL